MAQTYSSFIVVDTCKSICFPILPHICEIFDLILDSGASNYIACYPSHISNMTSPKTPHHITFFLILVKVHPTISVSQFSLICT